MALTSKPYIHFDVGDTCWIISDCGVQDGVVVSVEININFMESEIVHYVRLEGEGGQIPVLSDDIFADSTSALAEYGVRVTT